MAKSMNPMEAYRREQKKKELKKHRVERMKDKQAKLSSMDPAELKEQLKNLERQVAANPTDGPTRKRKQELEDTLRAVVKRQKEMAEEEHKKLADAPAPIPMSITKLTEANKEKFQNPENSIYYHPTLNPFGAPPPGKPQMYHNSPPGPVGPPRGLARGHPRQGRLQQQRSGDQPSLSRAEGGFRGPLPAPMQPRMMARRPGKRPPLPHGPPPPGTIQVPCRPPLPSGAIPARPPPPPPAHTPIANAMVPPPPPPLPQQPRGMAPPPPPYPATVVAVSDREMEPNQADVDMDEDGVVGPYPTSDFDNSRTEEEQEMDEEAAERAAESQAQLRSLVPVALRVQRQVPARSSSSVASVTSAPRVPAPRPPAPVPRPAMSVGVVPPPKPTTTAVNSSVSKEFDTFMEEVKELL